MTKQSLAWDIKNQNGETLVIFNGNIDETCDFSGLKTLSGKVTFDLAGVRRLNSDGVRRWVDFVRSLSSVDQLTFIRCSLAIVTQLNMVRGFKGKARIHSFYAPYICEETEVEEERLLQTSEVTDPKNPPTFSCSEGTLLLDDLPDRYFAFLTDQE